MVDGDDLRLTSRGEALRVAVRVNPRSSRSRLVGVRDGALVVAVAAPPVEGAANTELIKVLARALGLRRSALTIATGATGRNKLVDAYREVMRMNV